MRYKTRLLIIGTFLFIKVYRMNKDNRKIQIVWKKEENMVAEIRESQERESNRMSLSEDVIQKYRDDAGIIAVVYLQVVGMQLNSEIMISSR